jgi:phosphoribosylformylglycinamidine cyclo-ligase
VVEGVTTGSRSGGASYAAAGVDISAGEDAVARIRPLAETTNRPEVLDGVGGFAGLFGLEASRWRHPVLVASTDGVGTKLLVARDTGRYDTVGLDLVAMCADDLVCSGAEPLFLLDYLAAGRLDAARVDSVVGGVARGCQLVGCALLGGETAEHPGAMAPDDLDLAGFVVGVVERDEVLGPWRVAHGDLLVGLPSPGLRSNGYSLARHVLLGRAGRSLDAPAWPGAAHSLADELLVPSRIYCPAVRAAIMEAPGGLHAAAHITGGGIPGNVARILPEGADAVIDKDAWPVPRIFGEIRRLGEVADVEMARVFNLGIGMVLAVDPDGLEGVEGVLVRHGEDPVVIGRVAQGRGEVRIT